MLALNELLPNTTNKLIRTLFSNMPKSKETGIGTDPQYGHKYHLDKSKKIALKDLLEQRLSECGWRKVVEQKIRETLEERGLTNVTHEQLSAEIIPHARALVPEEVRKEMEMRVREALESPLHSNGNKLNNTG